MVIQIHDIPLVDDIELEGLEPGHTHRLRLEIIRNAMGGQVWVPVLVARGAEPGPIVLLTAAIHGNELNGIPVVQRLFKRLRPQELHGTVIGVPVLNTPGYTAQRREVFGGYDLNRSMPGREGGNIAEVYAHRVLKRLVRHANYLIDLHTASAGRVNSLYVRADLTNAITARMALLQQPQIIVHNMGGDSTLRSAASELGLNAITVEVGNPQRLQPGIIRDALEGVESILVDLQMLPERDLWPLDQPIVCRRSHWIYADVGGMLEVMPPLAGMVKAGEKVARMWNVFGDVVRELFAPEDGVVVGKSANPVSQTGDRVLHLGLVGLPEGAAEPAPTLAQARP